MPAPLKQGDTARPIQDQLLLDKSPINLTDCTVTLTIKPQSGGPAMVRSATITSPTSGQVEYWPVDEDVAVAGMFSLEWTVTYVNGKQLTAPTLGCGELEIYPKLQ